MGIEINYNKTISTKRIDDTESGDPGSEQYETLLTGVRCHIQPFEESYNEDIDGNFAKDWIMFCDVLDIQEGDLIIEGTNTYKVIGIRSFNFLCKNRHMELKIRKSND